MTAKTQRLDNHPNRMAIFLMWMEALKHPQDGQWREYTGQVRQGGRMFDIKGKFIIRNKVFTYKDLEVKPLNRERIVIQ
jgi:hypothetical protein